MEIGHLSGCWSLPRHATPYLVHVTKSKRWSPSLTFASYRLTQVVEYSVNW